MMFFIPLIPSYFGIAQWDLGSSFFFFQTPKNGDQRRRLTGSVQRHHVIFLKIEILTLDTISFISLKHKFDVQRGTCKAN
jgi:hypothetical protein